MGDTNPKNREKQKKIHEKQKEEQNAKVLHMKRMKERQQGNQPPGTATKDEKDYKKAG